MDEAKVTLDDVVDLLKRQVDLSTLANTLATATQALVQQQLQAARPDARQQPNPLPNPAGGRATTQPVPPLPPNPAGGRATTQGESGRPTARPIGERVPVFDRPNPVVLVGPNPVPVKVVGGGPVGAAVNALGGRATTQGVPSEPKTLLGRLWKGSRLQRAGEAATQKVGGLLGGKGPTGLGGLTGGAASLARFAGPVGIAITAVTTFASAVQGAYRSLIRLTDEQLAAARKFAEVNGQQALTFALRDVKELQRDMRQGAAQSGSTRRLAEAEQRRKDSSEKLENAIANAKNDVLANLNDKIAPLLETLGTAAETVMESDFFKGAALGVLGRKRDEEKKAEAEAIGAAADMGRIEREAARLEAEAHAMMAAAKAAAHGRVFPAGGRIP